MLRRMDTLQYPWVLYPPIDLDFMWVRFLWICAVSCRWIRWLQWSSCCWLWSTRSSLLLRREWKNASAVALLELIRQRMCKWGKWRWSINHRNYIGPQSVCRSFMRTVRLLLTSFVSMEAMSLASIASFYSPSLRRKWKNERCPRLNTSDRTISRAIWTGYTWIFAWLFGYN